MDCRGAERIRLAGVRRLDAVLRVVEPRLRGQQDSPWTGHSVSPSPGASIFANFSTVKRGLAHPGIGDRLRGPGAHFAGECAPGKRRPPRRLSQCTGLFGGCPWKRIRVRLLWLPMDPASFLSLLVPEAVLLCESV